MLQERRQSDEMVMKSCLLGHGKDPYKEKLREAFRNDGDSCSSYVCNASFGTGAFGEGEIFNTTFVSQLMFGTWETSWRNGTVHALRKITQTRAFTVPNTRVAQIHTNTGQ